MGRIIAIDFGLKRIGLAVTDPMQIIASPLTTVAPKELVSYLKEYDRLEGFESIVVGDPKKPDNTDTHITGNVHRLVEELKKHFPDKKICLHDERYTSKMALQALISGGSTKKDRKDKKLIDRVSAAIILQSFLEQKNLGRDKSGA